MAERPILFSGPMVRALLEGRKTQTRRVSAKQDWPEGIVRRWPNQKSGVPYAEGDRLWVREAWRTTGTHNGLKPSALPGTSPILFEADGESGWGWAGKLRPSMFMPRWASRLTLVVSEVRVERLQDISEADAIAEGCGQYASSTKLHRDRPFDPSCLGIYREGFSELWEGLNAARGYGWDANPWVVAVTFEVVKANIDRMTASPHSPLQDRDGEVNR